MTPYDGENMNASSDNEVNNYEGSPKTPYDGENTNTSSGDEGNNCEVSTDPPTNDVNIKASSDYVKFFVRLPLIQLQMVEILTLFTMMREKIIKKRLRRKQIMKT